MVQKEKQVKSYTRKSKSGKQVQVKSYSAKYNSAEDMVKEALKQKKGAGKELLEAKKNQKVENIPDYDFSMDDFAHWYEGDGSKQDKAVEKALKKALGTKAYNALNDKAADEYKKGGAHRFFTKGLEEMKASTSTSTKSVTPSKIATPNSIEEIAKAGLKRISVPSGKGDKKSAIYYTDGKQVYEPGEDGYLKKIAKNKMVPTARKLIDPPKSRASHKENAMGFSSLDWEASYGNGATGVDSDAAMRKIDKAARKYLGAKAYKKWAAYQDDSDDTGGSYKGFIKQLKRFKEGKDDWSGSMRKKYSGSTGRDAEVASLLGVSHSMRLAPTGYTKGAIQTAIRELKKAGDTKKVKSLEKLLAQKEKSKSKTSKKVPTWTAASAKKINSKESFRKLSTDSRLALNDFIRSQYKGQKYDLGHPSGHVHYVVDGYAITNEGTSAPESRKKFGVRLKPVSTGPGDPGSYRYLAMEDLKKYKMKK